jgi:hypothetical protein
MGPAPKRSASSIDHNSYQVAHTLGVRAAPLARIPQNPVHNQ